MPPIHEPRFKSAEVARAVGVSIDILKEWVSRKPPAVFLSAAERDEFGIGRPVLFSFQRAMQVALTARLVAHGYPSRRAALIAAAYSDVWSGGDHPDDGGKTRNPGELFASGVTLLVAHSNREAGRVVHLADPQAASIVTILDGDPDALVIVVDMIDRRLRKALGA